MSNIDNIKEYVYKLGGKAIAKDKSKSWICDDNKPVDEDLEYHMTIDNDVLKIVIYGIETGIEYSSGIDETDYNILIGNNEVNNFEWSSF
jgi:hypothetical protein